VQTYDAEGRITSRCYDYGGAGPTDCFKATYDPVGNPLAMTDPDGTDTITYDALDRVTSVQRTNGTATITEAYAYDPIGALSEYAGTPVADQRPVLGGSGTAPSPVPASYNGVPITIDGVGNITSLAGTSLGYDLKGPLTSVAGLGMRRDAFQRVTADSVANLAYTAVERHEVGAVRDVDLRRRGSPARARGCELEQAVLRVGPCGERTEAEGAGGGGSRRVPVYGVRGERE
jgi:YD repeat-containing protein